MGKGKKSGWREGKKKGRGGKGRERWGRRPTPHPPKKQKFTITLLPFAVSTGAVYYNGFMSVYWCVG